MALATAVRTVYLVHPVKFHTVPLVGAVQQRAHAGQRVQSAAAVLQYRWNSCDVGQQYNGVECLPVLVPGAGEGLGDVPTESFFAQPGPVQAGQYSEQGGTASAVPGAVVVPGAVPAVLLRPGDRTAVQSYNTDV